MGIVRSMDGYRLMDMETAEGSWRRFAVFSESGSQLTPLLTREEAEIWFENLVADARAGELADERARELGRGR